MERDEFADFLGQAYLQYTRWENNVVQPSTIKLVEIWQKLKTKFPEINLQDLLDL